MKNQLKSVLAVIEGSLRKLCERFNWGLFAQYRIIKFLILQYHSTGKITFNFCLLKNFQRHTQLFVGNFIFILIRIRDYCEYFPTNGQKTELKF